MAAGVKGEGLRQVLSPLYHHPPRLNQFCDRSAVHKWDLPGQLRLYFWSRLFVLFVKKMIFPTRPPFTILGHLLACIFLF